MMQGSIKGLSRRERLLSRRKTTAVQKILPAMKMTLRTAVVPKRAIQTATRAVAEVRMTPKTRVGMKTAAIRTATKTTMTAVEVKKGAAIKALTKTMMTAVKMKRGAAIGTMKAMTKTAAIAATMKMAIAGIKTGEATKKATTAPAISSKLRQ